jgi:hypothetical protein
MRQIAFSLLSAALVLSTINSSVSAADPVKVDLCVYGGTAGGVIAAVTAAKLGKSVILIEPSRHLGGMSSGGLGFTDFGNKAAIGGLSRDVYKRLGKFYGKDETWQFQPHHAEQVFKDLVAENKVMVLMEYRLAELQKAGRRIVSITVEKAPPLDNGAPAPRAVPNSEQTISAAMFIDATYEGDLLAKAGVSYHVGREAVATYNEPLNGIRPSTPKHQFVTDVDPYVKPGDLSSGLLPLIQSADPGKPGDGDRRVQTYNFRLCFTKDPANKLPITPPPGYDPARYELLARHVEGMVAAKKNPTINTLLKIDMMPGGKTDINNNGAVSTDFIGMSYDYPDGDWPTRSRIWTDHINYINGLVCFLANSQRIPASIRNEMAAWGLCKDEFTDTGGWPCQMYIREARRMIGRYVITQADCDHKTTIDDSVGLGAYNMDSHNCQRIVQNGYVRNEGDVQVAPRGPYAVAYRAITPKAEECENLVVPVALSASHIAYGSIRMEPVFMVLGQSASIAACQAMDEGKSVQEIDLARLKNALLSAGQVLEFK